jgi:hypothetical protein
LKKNATCAALHWSRISRTQSRCIGRAWGRASFDAAQHQVLDGIEADCSTPDGVADRGSHLIGAERLHEPQNLYELTLTLLAHPGFQETSQRHELLW